jgi:hypothetical protein
MLAKVLADFTFFDIGVNNRFGYNLSPRIPLRFRHPLPKLKNTNAKLDNSPL